MNKPNKNIHKHTNLCLKQWDWHQMVNCFLDKVYCCWNGLVPQ